MKKSVLFIIILIAMSACVSHVGTADIAGANRTLRTADSLERALQVYADTTLLMRAAEVFRAAGYAADEAKSVYHLGIAYEALGLDSSAFVCFSRAAGGFLAQSDSIYYPLSVLSMSLLAERQYKESGNATMLQAIRTLQREMINKQNVSKRKQWCLWAMISLLVIAVIAVCLLWRKRAMQGATLKRADLERNIGLVLSQGRVTFTLQWNDYGQFCQTVNAYLYNAIDKLHAAQPELSEQDIRFLVLVLLDLPAKEIADIMNLSQNSISNKKTRTAQKLGTIAADLRETLISLTLQTQQQ
ncbi:MAG: LuxR C-terminal-related transcriptional regulator [Paludibacteraceae bacterium]|nr:LuxR C-terminal-related transcriptional regulator [Paludibacteraceae bacterium]